MLYNSVCMLPIGILIHTQEKKVSELSTSSLKKTCRAVIALHKDPIITA